MAISKASISKSFIFRHLFLILVIIAIGVGYYFFYYTNDVKLKRIVDVADLKIDKTSKNYINDLYISDGRNYKYVLNEYEKEIYDILLTATKNFKTVATINLSDEKYKDFYFSVVELERIQEVMEMDHPELLQLGYFKLANNDSEKRIYQVEIRYALPQKKLNTAIKQTKKVLDKAVTDTKTMNDYEKAKYVYDFLGKKNNYVSNTASEIRSAYSALVIGKSNSTAYAKAAQLMLQYIKVNSILVSGTYKEEGHEWNLVKIDGKFYHFDASVTYHYKTQVGIVYTGFLFRNKLDYKLEYKNVVPRVNGKKYEYYSYNDLVFTYNNNSNRNVEEVGDVLKEHKESIVQLKIKNYSPFYRDANVVKAQLDLKAIYFIDEVAIFVKRG